VEDGDRSKGAGERRESVEGNLKDKTKIEGVSISQALKKAYIAWNFSRVPVSFCDHTAPGGF